MSEEISLASSHHGLLVEKRKTQPEVSPTTERMVLWILGGVIGGLMLVSMGFLGLVTYISASSQTPETPRLVCPPVCRPGAR